MSNALSITTIGTWALAIKRTLDAKGVNGNLLLQKAGIDIDLCSDPNTRLSSDQINKLWELSVEATGDHLFGITVPEHVHATTMHAITMANFAAFSLRDALERAVKYQRIASTGITMSLRDIDEMTEVIFQSADPHPQNRQSIEAIMYLHIKNAREIDLRPNNRPLAVHLKRPEKNDRQRLQQLFNCEILFDSNENKIQLDRLKIARSLATANPEIIQSCEKIMVDYLSRMDRANVSYRVHQLILELLPTGEPTQERIADQLHMSTRSLHRKLTSVGTNFKTLLDSTRRDLALQYIQQSNLSIADITYNLGFYDASSFSRAFKRWTQMSPAKYRREHIRATAV